MKTSLFSLDFNYLKSDDDLKRKFNQDVYRYSLNTALNLSITLFIVELIIFVIYMDNNFIRTPYVYLVNSCLFLILFIIYVNIKKSNINNIFSRTIVYIFPYIIVIFGNTLLFNHLGYGNNSMGLIMTIVGTLILRYYLPLENIILYTFTAVISILNVYLFAQSPEVKVILYNNILITCMALIIINYIHFKRYADSLIIEYELKKTMNKLEDEKKLLDKANKSKSIFMSNMNHEIRTPLNSIIGFSELLSQMKLDDVKRQYIKNINESSKALMGIINDVLDLSKIEANKLELDMNQVDFYKLINEIVYIMNYSFKKKNLEFIVDFDMNLPKYITLDKIRLKQVLINLLGNAVKFTNHGHILLKVELENTNDNVSEVLFSVKDTGIGISKEDKEKLFKPFSQVDNSTTKEYDGVGLGLAISDEIIRKFNSKIHVISEKNIGSEFYFTLKLKSEDKFIINKVDNKKLLIIDDNIDRANALNRYFKSLEYTTIVKNSYLESINIIDSSFDLIVIDNDIKDISGIEMVKLIRNDFKDVKILLNYNHINDDDNLNIDYLIEKPFMPCKFSEFNEMSICNEEEKKDYDKNEHAYKFLIVEDIEINIELIKTFLNKMNHNLEIFVAKNGLEAVEVYKENDIDLIFMDIQMPKLNGLKATEIIRAMNKDKLNKVIIIALTAGTLSTEKQACFDSGMDDFLTKPIDIHKLRDMYNKYIKKISEKVEDVEFDKSLIDKYDYIDNTKYGIKTFNKETLKEICANNLEDYKLLLESALFIENDLKDIKEFIISEEFKELKEVVHSFKGSTLNVGFEVLGNIATNFNKYLNKNNIKVDVLKYFYLNSHREWQSIKQEVEKELELINSKKDLDGE